MGTPPSIPPPPPGGFRPKRHYSQRELDGMRALADAQFKFAQARLRLAGGPMDEALVAMLRGLMMGAIVLGLLALASGR